MASTVNTASVNPPDADPAAPQAIVPASSTIDHGDEPWVSPEVLAAMQGRQVTVYRTVEGQPESDSDEPLTDVVID